MPRHQECPECLFIHPSTPPEHQEWETAFHGAFCEGAKGNILSIVANYSDALVAAMLDGFDEGQKVRRDS